MYSPPRNLKLDGQEFILNSNTNSIVMDIIQPFLKAGNILGWPDEFGSPGFGINEAIIKFVIQRKAKIVVHLLSESKSYWINYSDIDNFIKHNNCRYVISGKDLFVIPWKMFVHFGAQR